MKVLPLKGAAEQQVNEIIKSKSFVDLSLKVGYTFLLKNLYSGLDLFGVVKNIFKSYQEVFDTGKNRDINFIYEPSLPRTLYIGMKIFSFSLVEFSSNESRRPSGLEVITSRYSVDIHYFTSEIQVRTGLAFHCFKVDAF